MKCPNSADGQHCPHYYRDGRRCGYCDADPWTTKEDT